MSKAKKKNIVSVQIPEKDLYFTMYDLEGPIESIISGLRETEKQALALGLTDIRVSIYHNYDETEISLYGSREETDEEYKTRLGYEAKARKARAQAKAREELEKSEEYRKYIELKEKFG